LAKVHVSTLIRLEAAGWNVAPGDATTIDRVTVLENKGVEFIEFDVRLNQAPTTMRWRQADPQAARSDLTLSEKRFCRQRREMWCFDSASL
jgi:hypothetical protein